MPVHDPDPLDVFTAPPLDETEEQKVAREAEEAEAKRVNDLIDEGLKKDKAIMKKESGMVKILLLGQAESGEHDFSIFTRHSTNLCVQERAQH